MGRGGSVSMAGPGGDGLLQDGLQGQSSQWPHAA